MVFPQPMSRSEFGPDDSRVDDPRINDSSPPDPTRLLEQHLLAGFPPELALDLVLNEVVVHAVEATHAVAGALALMRDGQMVCRAATGQQVTGPAPARPRWTRHRRRRWLRPTGR